MTEPLPPFEEMKRIVRSIREHLNYADEVTNDVRIAVNNVQSLEQSILSSAFRGDLVSQNPNDEPASVLLERIRSQHANTNRNEIIPHQQIF